MVWRRVVREGVLMVSRLGKKGWAAWVTAGEKQ